MDQFGKMSQTKRIDIARKQNVLDKYSHEKQTKVREGGGGW